MRFADTSFWVGLQVPRDRRHADAVRLWQRDRSPVRTSNLVIGETWTWLRRSRWCRLLGGVRGGFILVPFAPRATGES